MINQIKNVKSKKYLIEIIYYLTLSLFICIFIKLLFHIPVRNIFHVLSTPLTYWGDTYGALTQAQNFISGGSLLNYPNVNAPFGWTDSQTLLGGGLLNTLLLFIGSRLTDKAGLILNVIYLISYPLIGITATFTLRKLNINHVISFMGGVLYAFLPYHFLRYTPHLWLGLYYMIPLVSLICVWIMNENIQIVNNHSIRCGNWFSSGFSRLYNKKMLFAVLTCIVLSFGELYTAFFAAMCIILASIYSSIRSKNISLLMAGLFLDFIIGLDFFIQLLPTIFIQKAVVSGNLVRQISDTETYGLKIIQLLLPVDEHRITLFANLKNFYNTNTVLLNENSMETIGLIMTIGFLLSITIMLFFRNHEKLRLISDLGVLNVLLVLICTVGGLNIFIAIFVSSVIRGYNRICAYIAFFSLIAVALLLQLLFDKIKEKIKGKWHRYIVPVFTVIIVFVTILGLYDQVPAWAAIRYTDDVPNKQYLRLDWEILNYKFPQDEWNNDDKFVKNIENTVPINSMIFQFPTKGGNRLEYLNDSLYVYAYDIWKPILHSTTLKWSSGYEANNESDIWNRYQETLPTNKMIDNLVYVGFNGIYIDSYAYPDNGAKPLMANIQNIVKSEPIISDNGRLYFYSLVDYGTKLKDGLTSDQLNQNKQDALYYVDIYNYPANLFPSKANESVTVSGKLTILNTKNGIYNSDGYLQSGPIKAKTDNNLLFGPYKTINAGKYKIEFELDTSNNTIPAGQIGYIGATSSNGKNTIFVQPFNKNDNNITVEFSVPKTADNSEIFIRTNQGNIVFKGYTITKMSN